MYVLYVSADIQAVDDDEPNDPDAGGCLTTDGVRSTDDCRDTPLILPRVTLLVLGCTAAGATTEAGRTIPGHSDSRSILS